MNIETFNYPNFNPILGYLTDENRKIFIKYILKDFNNLNYKNINSLIASNNKHDELYFWQLFSILGENNIKLIIETFYKKIFNEKNLELFHNKFIKSGNLDYHIKHQSNYWIDVMGGGKKYLGGEELLNYKHEKIKDIMNFQNSKIWIKYMLETLFDLKYHELNDTRIFKTLKDFIYFKMNIYSKEFNYNFIYSKL